MQNRPQRKPIYNRLRNLLPTTGNVIFTVLMIGITLWAQSAGAITLGATNQILTTTIPYQGYLEDSDGRPISGFHDVTFRLYTQPEGGESIWTERRTGADALDIDNGFIHIMLGSITALNKNLVSGNSPLYLGIAVGDDREMTSRVQLEDEPVIPMIQSGEVGGSKNDPIWTLLNGTGHREYKVAVTFDEPFVKRPNVAVSFSHIDILEGGSSHRLSVETRNITKTGFDLVFFTWNTTRVWRADATWIAYTSP